MFLEPKHCVLCAVIRYICNIFGTKVVQQTTIYTSLSVCLSVCLSTAAQWVHEQSLSQHYTQAVWETSGCPFYFSPPHSWWPASAGYRETEKGWSSTQEDQGELLAGHSLAQRNELESRQSWTLHQHLITTCTFFKHLCAFSTPHHIPSSPLFTIKHPPALFFCTPEEGIKLKRCVTPMLLSKHLFGKLLSSQTSRSCLSVCLWKRDFENSNGSCC